MPDVENRRFLVVPPPGAEDVVVVSCATTGTDAERNEAGLQIGQPERVPTDAPNGDIALTLSGTPETHVEGIAALTREGVVEDARWGWVREGDDPDTDLQFRQSPHVVGRRVDNIDGGIYGGGSDTSRQIRPRLLVLASGDVLMVWMRRIWMPIWARDATTLGGGPTDTIRWSRLDHTTDTWSAPALGPYPVDATGAGPCISAVDIAQFPDTGEIVMCVATSETMTPGSAEPRIMFVYVSQDDGDTWTLKHRLHFDGDIPDIILDTDGDGDVDDDTPFQDWALERLESDRLCLVGCTESNTWSLISDDRGASWSVVHLQTHSSISAGYNYAGHGCGVGMARNGIACYMTALRNSGGGGLSSIGLWMTRDGVSFSARVLIPYATPIFQSVDVTACMSPDGWVHIYGTEHASKRDVEATLNPQDWIWGRRLKTRDPDIADTLADLVPYGPTASGPATALHLHTGTPDGSYEVPVSVANPCTYAGFVGVDAVLYRGQVLMAVVHQRDESQPETDTQPKLGSDALMVYRLNYWQPAQERVNNALQSPSGVETLVPAWPAIGRIYNAIWDCYDKPESVGWSKTGAGTVTVERAGTEGGYLSVSGAPCYWTRDVTGNLDIGLAANIRLVLRVVDGGSTSTDAIAVRLSLRDGVGRTDVSIRFLRTGANVVVSVYDNVNGAQLGSSIQIHAEDWTEVLYAQHRLSGSTSTARAFLFARRYHRSVDPDWDAPYETADEDGTTFLLGSIGSTNYLRWGHLESGDPETWWKSVHLSRSWAKTGDDQSNERCAVVRAGTDYIDDDAVNDRSTTGTGEPPLDNGIDNWMRCCRTLAEPRMFMSRGVHASFRGEAVTRGTWSHATTYAYAAANVLRQPVLREYRGETDDVETAIVLDGGGRGFRPDAVAVFGSNVPGMTFEFNSSDSWTTPLVSFAFRTPGVLPSPDRYIHEWYAASGFDSNGYRIVYESGSPWRPHQFKSDAGGAVHYFGRVSSGRMHLFRILDNTENTLIVDVDTATVGFSVKGSGMIMSDRFACMVGHHFDDVNPDPSVTYRYCRIVLDRSKHWGGDDQSFPRIGRIVLGQTIEISAPDFEWGWRTGYKSGAVLTEQPTGAAYTKRLRSIQRTWSVDRPVMMPPPESSAVTASPASQPSTASWAGWYDTIRRIDGDGVACALIWDSPWFVGFTDEERVQCAVDPLGVAMCHVTALGTLEHAAYTPETLNLAGGASCAPRAAASVRQIDMTETF